MSLPGRVARCNRRDGTSCSSWDALIDCILPPVAPTRSQHHSGARPITRRFWTTQGNASGALLHDQYIQSLFAAAADGLLHSPASLLGLAAPPDARNADAAGAEAGVPGGETPSSAAAANASAAAPANPDGGDPTQPALTQVKAECRKLSL